MQVGASAIAVTRPLATYGARLGSAEVQTWAEQANEYTPVLRTHDRFGHRVDEVEYHPAYHALLALAVELLARLAKEKGIDGGIALSLFMSDRPNDFLVCVTEINSREQIEALVEGLKSL